MFNPLVRIIILNYNQSALTLECIKSVKEQSYSYLQILVVDNNSRDSEYSFLKDNTPSDVFIIKSSTNVGYARGNNLGCSIDKLPNPKFLMILNNDTILNDKNTISILVNTFIDKGETCAVVAPLVNTISSGPNVYTQIQGRRVLSTFKLIVANSAFLSKLPFGRRISNEYLYKDIMPYKKNSIYEVDCVSGAAFMFNSQYLDDGKIFDESTFLYFEEIILAQRLLNLEVKSYINTSTSILHIHGASTGKRGKKEPYKMFLHSVKSELYFYKKYRNLKMLSLLVIVVLKNVEYVSKKILYSLI